MPVEEEEEDDDSDCDGDVDNNSHQRRHRLEESLLNSLVLGLRSGQT